MGSGVWQCLWVTAVVVTVLFLITLVVGLLLGRMNVVDTTWGLGFVAVAVTAFLLSDGDTVRRVVVLVIVAVWGLRLSTYMFVRARGQGEDPRYVEMLGRRPGGRVLTALRVVILPQGLAVWFVSLPVQVAMYERSSAGVVLYVGLVVWVIGFAFEAGGDWQLSRFRADPANRGQVMDRGFWRYTRHPNYFGDACQWFGIYIIAAQQWQGLLTVLSPAVMTYFLVAKTGKKMLEKDIGTRRPGYADYVRRTSGFFPLPPRRA